MLCEESIFHECDMCEIVLILFLMEYALWVVNRLSFGDMSDES